MKVEWVKGFAEVPLYHILHSLNGYVVKFFLQDDYFLFQMPVTWRKV